MLAMRCAKRGSRAQTPDFLGTCAAGTGDCGPGPEPTTGALARHLLIIALMRLRGGCGLTFSHV